MEQNKATGYTIYQLEQMAETVLTESGFTGINVDVVKLANMLGYAVFQANLSDNIAGQVIKNKQISAIYINANDAPSRQRFSIAHEIAHILLHHNPQEETFTDYRNNGTYSQQEFEADNFAAALLMPKDRSLDIWNICKDVDDFANAMRVSKAAASIRLTNLGLI